MKQMCKRIMTNSTISAFIFASCVTAAALLEAGYAHAQPPPCDLQIKACGCVITTSAPDVYEAANDLSASQTDQPNCIEIAATHAILNLKGKHVSGNDDGTGIGILIRQSADHVIVEGGDEAQEEKPQAVVSLWKIGLQDDADDAVILLFDSFGASFLKNGLKGNSLSGVILNGVTHTVLGNAHALFNGKFGVMLTSASAKGKPLKHTTDSTLYNIAAGSNGDTGLLLESSPRNFLGTATSSKNTRYGILMKSSADNLVGNDTSVAGNGKVGILLGEGHESNDNFVTNALVTGSEMGGIVIDNVNRGNIVTLNRTSGNGKFDLIDRNSNCDHNRWYNNMGTGNPSSCIQ